MPQNRIILSTFVYNIILNKFLIIVIKEHYNRKTKMVYYMPIPWPTLSSIRRCLMLIINFGGRFLVNCATSS